MFYFLVFIKVMYFGVIIYSINFNLEFDLVNLKYYDVVEFKKCVMEIRYFGQWICIDRVLEMVV